VRRSNYHDTSLNYLYGEILGNITVERCHDKIIFIQAVGLILL
jgi:hypothetical protein